MKMKRVDGIREGKYTKGNADDYATLLRNIMRHYEIRPVRDHPVEGSVCYLHHDVDFSIDGALQMAQIEAELGVKSTYYIRPVAAYMRRATVPIRAIAGLGHEIGYHHSLMVRHLRKGTPLERLLTNSIAKLERLGLKVKTVCAHGDPETIRDGYSNYEAFEECPPQLRKSARPTGIISLKKHGLRSVDFLPRDCYLWDSGGGWKYSHDPHVDDWNGTPLVWPRDPFLKNLGDLDAEQLSILTHPVWWAFYVPL